VRTKANTGSKYVTVAPKWADIPDQSDSATDKGTSLVGQGGFSPFAAEEPVGGRQLGYNFPAEPLALWAGVPNEITQQEAPQRAAPRQYAPALLGPLAVGSGAAATRGVLGGHVSDGGREEQPRGSRRMVQYFSEHEGQRENVDPGAAELLVPASEAPALRLLGSGKPPRDVQKQKIKAGTLPKTVQVRRQTSEPDLSYAEDVEGDEDRKGACRGKGSKRRHGFEEADEAFCCICFENPKDAALAPCGHLLCADCAEIMHKTRKTCPVCSKKIDLVLKLYDTPNRLPAFLR
jgi:hypothetical protein